MDTFLDVSDIEAGDDFGDEILATAERCDDLVILLTPSSKARPYVSLEVGAFLGSRKRVVVVLSGITLEELVSDYNIPTAMNKLKLIKSNDLDRYLGEVERRATERKNE